MRINRVFTCIPLLAAVLFFFLLPSLHAQYDNGSLVGTIRDKSGAAVPNAVVTVTNNATAAVTQGNDERAKATMKLPSLHVGVYTISASAPGFTDCRRQ